MLLGGDKGRNEDGMMEAGAMKKQFKDIQT